MATFPCRSRDPTRLLGYENQEGVQTMEGDEVNLVLS